MSVPNTRGRQFAFAKKFRVSTCSCARCVALVSSGGHTGSLGPLIDSCSVSVPPAVSFKTQPLATSVPRQCAVCQCV